MSIINLENLDKMKDIFDEEPLFKNGKFEYKHTIIPKSFIEKYFYTHMKEIQEIIDGLPTNSITSSDFINDVYNSDRRASCKFCQANKFYVFHIDYGTGVECPNCGYRIPYYQE